MEHTKSNFADGTTSWKAVNAGKHWNNQEIDNWQIHWSDDGECISDHVYAEADAKLIAAAPDLLSACNAFIKLFQDSDMRPEDESHELFDIVNDAVLKATS